MNQTVGIFEEGPHFAGIGEALLKSLSRLVVSSISQPGVNVQYSRVAFYSFVVRYPGSIWAPLGFSSNCREQMEEFNRYQL